METPKLNPDALADLYEELESLVEWVRLNDFEGEFLVDDILAGPRASLSRARTPTS